MTKKWKRGIGLFLVCCMLLTLLPMAAFSATEIGTNDKQFAIQITTGRPPAIAYAHVQILDSNNIVVYEGQACEDGIFILPALPDGIYTILAEASAMPVYTFCTSYVIHYLVYVNGYVFGVGDIGKICLLF